eukprot:6197737-Pleurochrysis_carterae.AAC.5
MSKTNKERIPGPPRRLEVDAITAPAYGDHMRKLLFFISFSSDSIIGRWWPECKKERTDAV